MNHDSIFSMLDGEVMSKVYTHISLVVKMLIGDVCITFCTFVRCHFRYAYRFYFQHAMLHVIACPLIINHKLGQFHGGF